MDIEIKGTAKALDQPHRNGFDLFIGKASFANNVSFNTIGVQLTILLIEVRIIPSVINSLY